ncbi:MAG: glycosyltransferase [Anaerolineales bacterium]|nr:glycosyltransferase [Anaerolineales bacterium]
MNLIMITPRVGTSNPILAFIPNWIKALSEQVDHLWVISPRVEIIDLPGNVSVFEVGRDYTQRETVLHAAFHYYRVLWHLLRIEKVDGVLVHMYPRFAIMAAPLTKARGVPLAMWYTHQHVNWQLKAAHWLVDLVLTASAGSFRIKSNKVKVMGHGIDTDTFRPRQTEINPEQKIYKLLTVGRISPSKRVEDILAAVDILVNCWGHTNFELIIVGDSPQPNQKGYLDELRAITKEKHLENVVNFVGKIPHSELVKFYHSAVLFLSASQSGLDKAILEAMSCGVPVIASNPEFIPLMSGFDEDLYYVQGNAYSLAEKIDRMLKKNESERWDIGQSLRSVVCSTHRVERLMEMIVQEINIYGEMKNTIG